MREMVQQSTSSSTELAATAEQMSKLSRALLESMDRFALDDNFSDNRRRSRAPQSNQFAERESAEEFAEAVR